MDLIQDIISSLKQYPYIKFEQKNEGELKIFGAELSGFDMIVFEGEHNLGCQT